MILRHALNTMGGVITLALATPTLAAIPTNPVLQQSPAASGILFALGQSKQSNADAAKILTEAGYSGVTGGAS